MSSKCVVPINFLLSWTTIMITHIYPTFIMPYKSLYCWCGCGLVQKNKFFFNRPTHFCCWICSNIPKLITLSYFSIFEKVHLFDLKFLHEYIYVGHCKAWIVHSSHLSISTTHRDRLQRLWNNTWMKFLPNIFFFKTSNHKHRVWFNNVPFMRFATLLDR